MSRNRVLANQLAFPGAGYSPGDARSVRDAAIDAVGSAASRRWMHMATLAVKYVAERRDLFTTDAVWYVLEERWKTKVVVSPHERRAMGAVMREAAKHGWIELSGLNSSHASVRRHVESVRKVCHARPLTVWRSKLRRAQGA